jgi:hypothetical protein
LAWGDRITPVRAYIASVRAVCSDTWLELWKRAKHSGKDLSLCLKDNLLNALALRTLKPDPSRILMQNRINLRENTKAPSLMPEDYIWIVTDDAAEPPASGQRGWGEEVQRRLAGLKEVKLPVSELEQKMNSFLQLVGRLFKQVDQQVGSQSEMKLDEVELSVEISGEGEVKLVAGGKAASKGAITLKFKRAVSK